MNKLNVLNDIGFVKLISSTNVDIPLSVVNAARISYNKSKEEFDGKDKKLVDYLWSHGHTSPFRHAFYTFHIKAPLFVFNQWKKYQVGSTWRSYEVNQNPVSLEVFDEMYDTDKGCSWNEVSGRYTELKPEFYVPKIMRENPIHGNKQVSVEVETPTHFTHEEWHKELMLACTNQYAAYTMYIQNGIAKEIARMILPQNIYSESYWTVSLQALLHFFSQRMNYDAQHEIRCYAEAIYDLVDSDLTKLGFTKASFRR